MTVDPLFRVGEQVTVLTSPIVDSPELCAHPRVVIAEVLSTIGSPRYRLASPDGRLVPWQVPVAGRRMHRGWI